MDNNFEDLLKSTAEAVLPGIKADLERLDVSCTDVLVFIKNDGSFIVGGLVNLNNQPTDFGFLKISEEVFADGGSGEQLKFIDDATTFFSDIKKDSEVYIKNLGRSSFAVYSLTHQKTRFGAIVYVFPKETEIAEKEKAMLLLVSQSISLNWENQLLSEELKSIIGKEAALQERIDLVQKQKDEFVSMAAHELRAPMTAIKGYISMVLEGDTGDIPEKARGFLADANNINDRLIRLVNNMLNVSRIEEGRMVYQIEEEYLSHVVRAVFGQFRPEAERKGLDYKLEILPNIYDKVEVDPDRVQEVIGNLISNAIKYTDSGSITLKMDQPDKGYVRCEIIDTGIGISREEQGRLFQKFQRVESNVGKTTGTGLGLYICKLLVERFGGKIGLESEPGKGSTFWFELPVVS